MMESRISLVSCQHEKYIDSLKNKSQPPLQGAAQVTVDLDLFLILLKLKYLQEIFSRLFRMTCFLERAQSL